MIIAVVTLVVALVGVVAFLIYREWYHSEHIEQLEKRYFEERQMLLDRVMAVDFVEYKQAEVATKMQTQITTAQPYRAVEEDIDWTRVGE